MKCSHHWVIEAPRGLSSIGVCKICGKHRRFYNSLLINTLLDCGQGSVQELAELIEAAEPSVRAELTRSKDTFIQLPNKNWGLLDKKHSIAI